MKADDSTKDVYYFPPDDPDKLVGRGLRFGVSVAGIHNVRGIGLQKFEMRGALGVFYRLGRAS